MNTKLVRKAIELFPSVTYQPKSKVKHLRRKWLEAVNQMGSKWILSKPIEVRA